MSRVTSGRCQLTPDDTTNAQFTLNPPIIINMWREMGHGSDRRRKIKQVSKQKQINKDDESRGR